jgi:2-C-methyl-D-erythritol 2,4-cyclodiphosphate synthase
MSLRIGYGYDVHRLVAGRKLMLGGVHISFAQGLDGHSDADVLLHAVCDAILGALALGDIGVHFPDTDGRFKDIASLELLSRVVHMAREKGYAVGNIDVSLVAERPKIAAYTGAMRDNIAKAANIASDRVSIKATTAEGLGTIGRGEGIAAHAVVLMQAMQ